MTELRWRDRLRATQPRTILAIAWIGFVLYGYPGYVTAESADELVNARGDIYTDWGSPVMGQIWHWLGWVVSGPPAMIFVHSVLWLGGGYALLGRVLAPRRAAIAAGALLWFPPVLAGAAVVSPDSLVAAFLIGGTAAIASPRRVVQAGGSILLCLACGLREGAAIAVLPIIALGFAPWPARSRMARLAIALGAWLVIAAAGLGLRAVAVEGRSGRRELALARHDIAGTLRFAGALDAPTLARQLHGVPLVTTDDLEANARRWYRHPEQLIHGDHRLFDEPHDLATVDRVVAGRDRIVHAHRGAYLRYRFHVLLEVLGLTRTSRGPWAYQLFAASPDHQRVLQHAGHHSAIQRPLVAAVRALSKTVLFRPYLYFAIAVIALVLARMRRDRLAVLLLASALGHALALMFVTIEPDRNATAWLIGATTLAVIQLVAAWREARRPTG